jgi:hypothetical protein
LDYILSYGTNIYNIISPDYYNDYFYYKIKKRQYKNKLHYYFHLVNGNFVYIFIPDLGEGFNPYGINVLKNNGIKYSTPPLHITGRYMLRARQLSLAFGRSGYEKPQPAYGLCTVFLRHILARRNATNCFIGGPKLSDCRASGSQTAGTLGGITP